MRLRTVDPATVVIPPVRVTSYFDNETLEEFRRTVKELGIVEPPICMETPEGLVVVDGKNRIEQALAHGIGKLQVVVQEGTMADVMILNLVTSFTKGRHRAIDLVRVIGSLWSEHHLGIDDLVSRTGMSRDYVERLITVSEGRPEILSALDDGRIGVGHAYVLARARVPTSRCGLSQEHPQHDGDCVVCSGELQAVLLHQQLTYAWTVKALQEHIATVAANLQSPPPEAAPGEPAPEPTCLCHYCREPHDLRNIRSVFICPACDGVLYATLQQLAALASVPQVSTDGH